MTIGPFHDWNTLPMYTGLATIRRDGFASLEVNADGLVRGTGRISVDLLRGDEVLATSNAVTDDRVANSVRWLVGGKRLRLPEPGQLSLRFLLEGEALLYSFTFR